MRTNKFFTLRITDQRLLSNRARADTSAPGSSSWLSNMEFSTNSMTDNSFDKDNPLK